MKLQSINPATGTVVGEVETTPIDRIPQIVARARAAQREWGGFSFEQRRKTILPAGCR